MIKNINKKQKILILLVIIAFLITLGIGVSGPILDALDKNKFVSLEKDVQLIADQFSGISSDNKWKYESSCDPQLSGDWPTGKYLCSSSISMSMPVSDVGTVNSVNQEYASIMDSNSSFVTNSDVISYPINSFGKSFSINRFEKSYSSINSKISCSYIASLHNNTNLGSYGDTIKNGLGELGITFNCSALARDYWYTISNQAYLKSPNSPLKK